MTLPAVTDLSKLSDAELETLALEILGRQRQDRQQNQLFYYKPVSPTARTIHLSTAKTVGIGGGNGASKTDSALAEMIIRATGRIPETLAHDYPREKLRGPIACRVVCESLTTTLVPIILPKLQWWRWSGIGQPGSLQGHWGWIPKDCLMGGEWKTSWTERLRLLRVLYRDPETNEVVGESSIQFMCLTGDQRVRMASGEWRAIKDIAIGDVLSSPKGHTKVISTVQYENVPTYRLRCTGGREIVATTNHRHFLSDGSIRRTDELMLGDALLTFPIVGDREIGKPMPEWLLGWLGIILGDGCTRRRDVGFSANPGSRVLASLPPLPPNTRMVQMPSNLKEYRIWTTKGRRNNPLVRYLKRAGLWGLTSAEKFVPPEIFTQPSEQIAYFLKHIWNCDGSVNIRGRQACYISISKRLAYDIKYLLWSLGIYAGVTDGTYPCGFTGKPIHRYTVQVSGGSFDRFNAALGGENFEDIPIETKGVHGIIKDISFLGSEDVYCVEVDNVDHAFVVDGLVTHNSYDQDASDFASGDFHFILHDEPPKWDIWRENRARVMRVDGTLMLAMTWPDDPTIAVDWIFDEIYEKAQPGPAKDPSIDWVNLYTTDNPNLNQQAVQGRAAQMSDMERQVRIFGQPIRFSSRVHADFTDQPRAWCVECGKEVIAIGESCGVCQGSGILHYCHVAPLVAHREWPVIYTLDPHPRKPHMMAWTQITPNDDLEQIVEVQVAGGPEEVATMVNEIESEYGWSQVQRLIDPNMGRSPASTKRGVTWQEEFENVGLVCDLADDADVGRARLNDYLKPDRFTGTPRWHVDPRCTMTIFQLKRYCWDDYRLSSEKGTKQTPKPINDDYPTQIKYLMNTNPSFRGLKSMGLIVRRMGERGAHGY